MSHSPSTDAHGGSEATLSSYTIGFVLAVILTVIPFGVVGFELLPPTGALITVAASAVIQILVHLYFFLHLDVSREHLASTMSGAFTALIMALLVGGTIWLFYSLDYRTMVMGG